MERDDLMWLAGLLEGEGSFDLRDGRYPRIRVGMTDRDTVGRVASLIGVRVRLSFRRAPEQAMWHAEVTGARAAEVMELVLPHMGARRSARIATILGHARLRPDAVRTSAPGPRVKRPPALSVA